MSIYKDRKYLPKKKSKRELLSEKLKRELEEQDTAYKELQRNALCGDCHHFKVKGCGNAKWTEAGKCLNYEAMRH